MKVTWPSSSIPQIDLQDMQDTLEKEQKADEDMYDDLKCWCKAGCGFLRDPCEKSSGEMS